jgi:hypothetical protein
MYTGLKQENPKEKAYLKNLGIDGKVSKYNLNKINDECV